MKRGAVLVALLSVIGIMGATTRAATFNSSNFSINGNLGDSMAGGQNSSNYQLTSAGGESIVGNGSSASYKLGQGYVARMENSLQLTVQQSNLYGYYPFDEETGATAYDNTTNNNNGLATGSTLPTWGAGKVGGATTFTSTTAPFSVPLRNTNPATGSFTMSAWINPADSSSLNSQTILSSFDTSTANAGFKFSLEPVANAHHCTAADVCFAAYAGGTVKAVAIAKLNNIADGTWAHVTVTADSTSLKMYLNGALMATTVTAGLPAGIYNLPMCMGSALVSNSCSTETYSGKLDEVKLYNKALTAAEVQAEYSAQNTGIQSALVFPNLTPGTSQTVSYQGVVQTDAPGYSLALSQNQNLTNGANSIAGVSGTIASPVAWTEGTTKGLGFSLVDTNATAVPGKWNGGASYASIPSSSSSFYTRTGFTAGQKDYLNMRLRLDTSLAQNVGLYTNQMTITGTMTP